MERFRVIKGIEEDAGNGGIPVDHKALQRATDAYGRAVAGYSEAKKNLIEAAFPRHYRTVIWGSARLDEATPEYIFTRDLAEALVTETGCDIVTGGGPGIMQAAIEGGLLARQKAAKEGRILTSRNRGVRIELPFEEETSPLLDAHTLHTGFSTRLDEFLAVANAVYVAPGGIGTDLELKMIIQSRQVGHVEKFPILAHPFWITMLDSMKFSMYDNRVQKGEVPLVNKEDLENIIITDDISEIVGIISEHHSSWKENIHSKIKKQEQGKLF